MYFTTITHIISKKSYKKQRRKVRVIYYPRKTYHLVSKLIQGGTRRKQRKVTWEKNNIQEWLFSKGLYYLQHFRILPCWGLQTFYSYYPISTMPIGLLVAISVTYNTSRDLPPFLYCLQHTTFFRSQSLLLIIVPFSLQVTCQCFPVAFYNQIQNVIFWWQPLTYYSRGYQMVCLFIFYFRRNAKIPFQGSNLVVQSQTILPPTFFNRIEIQPTH